MSRCEAVEVRCGCVPRRQQGGKQKIGGSHLCLRPAPMNPVYRRKPRDDTNLWSNVASERHIDRAFCVIRITSAVATFPVTACLRPAEAERKLARVADLLAPTTLQAGRRPGGPRYWALIAFETCDAESEPRTRSCAMACGGAAPG